MRSWQTILKDIVQRPDLHGPFLNTLSLLEYIGARKIMKSQEETQITPTVLAHITEEIRHAQIIKKLALKVGGSRLKTYEEDTLLCGMEGREYIQAIDSKAQEVLGQKDSFTNYLLTTLIIEERAQALYPYYDELLAAIGLAGPLKAIFREEEEHLDQVLTLLKTVGHCSAEQFEYVRREERLYFDRFFAKVDEVLAAHDLAAHVPH